MLDQSFFGRECSSFQTKQILILENNFKWKTFKFLLAEFIESDRTSRNFTKTIHL